MIDLCITVAVREEKGPSCWGPIPPPLLIGCLSYAGLNLENGGKRLTELIFKLLPKGNECCH